MNYLIVCAHGGYIDCSVRMQNSLEKYVYALDTVDVPFSVKGIVMFKGNALLASPAVISTVLGHQPARLRRSFGRYVSGC